MSKCFIVAEMSANHNGNKQVAIETIKAAKRAGADAIKLQTYTADTITLDCKSEDFKIKQGTIWMVAICMIFINELILLGNGMKNFFMLPERRDWFVSLLRLIKQLLIFLKA